jgi:hypothetical protein
MTGESISAQAREHLRSQFAGQDTSNLLTVDLVLVLLRAGLVADAEVVAGCPIQYGPSPRLRPLPLAPSPPSRPDPDARRITQVVPNPRLPTTPSWGRFRCLRPGMTVAQALRRGVTRRDLREAVRRRWVELSPT